MQEIRLDVAVIKAARERLFATQKLRMILDDKGINGGDKLCQMGA